MTVWFVTGASRGLGAAIVEQALLRGDSVVAAARRPDTIRVAENGDRMLAVALDVTDEHSAQRAVAAAVERFGRLDVVVNSAGTSLVGAVEEASAAEVEGVFATNLFGTLNVIRAALPVMRAQRSGRVVNIGSMGRVSRSPPGWGNLRRHEVRPGRHQRGDGRRAGTSGHSGDDRGARQLPHRLPRRRIASGHPNNDRRLRRHGRCGPRRHLSKKRQPDQRPGEGRGSDRPGRDRRDAAHASADRPRRRRRRGTQARPRSAGAPGPWRAVSESTLF